MHKLISKRAVQHLRELGDSTIDPNCLHRGLCRELYRSFEVNLSDEGLLYSVFADWEKYSGSRGFPVPCTVGEHPAEYYMTMCSLKKNIWDISTQYGRDRRELCLFTSKVLARLLKS